MAVLDKEYDVIVIGAGISGLACAAYLQKSGLKVAAFERRVEAGAHCCTEELMHPGVKVSLCANLMHTLASPAYYDLELERFGLEMLTSSEWGAFYPIKRDRSAVLYHNWDARKTYEAWKRISEKDAEVFRKLANYVGPRIVDWFEAHMYPRHVPHTSEGPDPLADIPLPSGWQSMNGIEVIEEMYEDPRIKASAYALAIQSGHVPWTRSPHLLYAYIYPLLQGYSIMNYTTKGGAHSLTHALSRSFVHYGGSVFTSCPVAKIIVENGEAKGVALSKNAVYPEAEIRATKAVVSNLSAHPTFIDMVGLDKMPSWSHEGIKAHSYEDVILHTGYWALSEPLDWESAGYPAEINWAYGFNFGLDDALSDVMRLKNDLEAGRTPDPPICCGLDVQGFCQADPTQAPPGQYTLLTWANVPYDLTDYPDGALAWDDIREEYGDKVEDLLAEYVPNLKKAKINRYCEPPLGFYRRNPSAIMGSAISGALNRPEQVGANFPFPGCGAPRSPIAKLYLSQIGSTYLNVGYQAATAVAQDLGIRDQQDWWGAKPLEPALKVLKSRGITPRWTVD